jgi:hypothetical protein
MAPTRMPKRIQSFDQDPYGRKKEKEIHHSLS